MILLFNSHHFSAQSSPYHTEKRSQSFLQGFCNSAIYLHVNSPLIFPDFPPRLFCLSHLYLLSTSVTMPLPKAVCVLFSSWNALPQRSTCRTTYAFQLPPKYHLISDAFLNALFKTRTLPLKFYNQSLGCFSP